MKRETIQMALNVLNAIVVRAKPDPAEIESLRRALGPGAQTEDPEELARTVIERYLSESKQISKAG